MSPSAQYSSAFAAALLLSGGLTFLMRWVALRWGVLDHPSTPVKTHRTPTPYLGGVAIFLAVVGTLLLLRLVSHFPTGTLRSLRAILLGGGFMAAVGLVDDVKAGGLSFRWKFFFQFLAALILIAGDIRLHFVQPSWLAYALTVFWVVGVINAFNIIDIMDGLSSSQALVASLGFLFISLPTEDVYVNFAAAATAGACLGFLPHNLSDRRKIFMGDAGSLTLGFFMAALSMGTTYSQVNDMGLFAPLLILGLPLYDTFFVSVLRMKQGKSPFLGSKDHMALKLRRLGLSSRRVVGLMAAAAAVFSGAAYVVTRAPFYVSIYLLAAISVFGLFVLVRLYPVKVDE